jgi:hypothetical protein
MSRKWIIGLAVASMLAPSTAAAQESGAIRAVRSEQGGGGRGGVVVGGVRARTADVEGRVTTGRPYSADAVTETTQVLGDGNRIHTRSLTRVYRDSEGRTRREMFDKDGVMVSISISDPVAKTSYTLDPKTRTARQGQRLILATPSEEGRVVVMPTPALPGATGGGRGRVARTAETPGTANSGLKTEDLGTQNIEGVSATGMRTTRIIPAGEIGNVQEIQVVSEQWFSEDLQVLVMTRHSDPRTGETVYRLVNIVRAEPDRNLFTVPPDYTIQGRTARQPE